MAKSRKYSVDQLTAAGFKNFAKFLIDSGVSPECKECGKGNLRIATDDDSEGLVVGTEKWIEGVGDFGQMDSKWVSFYFTVCSNCCHVKRYFSHDVIDKMLEKGYFDE